MPSGNLHRFAVFVACATFLLVLAGGLVTSTGSALAVPDWPLSYGQFFPRMEGGVLFEHGHRMIAGTIGLLTIVLAIWLWRKEPRPGVRRLGLWAIAAVCAQALLGGITVLYRLPAPVSVAHACLGQIFFALMVCIAILTGAPPAIEGTSSGMAKLKRLGLVTTGIVFLQLIAGATLRHTGYGLHLHLLGALLVAIHIPLLAKRVLLEVTRLAGLRTLAAALPLMVIVQLVLGYFAWKTGPILITTAHVGLGALILAGSVVITLQASRMAEAFA